MGKILRSIFVILWAGSMQAAEISTSQGPATLTMVLGGLDQPWGLAFLPDGGFLVTERGGKLIHVTPKGQKFVVSGSPKVVAKGQGGLLDVMVPDDFRQTRHVYLSYAKPQERHAGTALDRARLSDDGTRLERRTTIFEMSPGSSGGRHFGSRIVQGGDGMIYLSVGERGDRDAAQDLSRHNGSIIRIHPDGGVPADNPFAGTSGAFADIWSFGHRNPQGAALDLQGRLWVTEHGAKGGDEVNRIRKGANYGWPIIAYGRHYSGAKIGVGTHEPGLKQPAHYWDPSIAPSGLMIYSGKLWPKWRGHFFVGSLKFDYIARLDPTQDWTEEQLKTAQTTRVRDVREAPDGSIWFISADEGAIYRMTPPTN